jgi:ABC-type phosphate transport system permease subunit
MMVIIMSLAVVPFGVLAALYLREYARQGVMVRLVRIAVNNLAGVPSIVFSVFGLGFSFTPSEEPSIPSSFPNDFRRPRSAPAVFYGHP